MDDIVDETVDINEAFDNILLSEEKIVQNSYQTGLSKGISEGEVEGFHLGYHRGSEIGYEIGVYSGFVDILMNVSSLNSDFPQKASPILAKLKKLVQEFPQSNEENCDMFNLMEDIRALYKKLCAILKIDTSLPLKDKLAF